MAKTIKEWEADVRRLSLHDRSTDELRAISASAAAKVLRVKKDIKEQGLSLFPDVKKQEIYSGLVAGNVIEDEPEGTTSLSLENQAIVDQEYRSQVQFYSDKISRLEEFVAVADKVVSLNGR